MRSEIFYQEHITDALKFLQNHYSPEQCRKMREKRGEQYIRHEGRLVRKIDLQRAREKASTINYRRTQHGHARESGRNDVKKFILQAIKHKRTTCPICNQTFNTKHMTVDHIVPLKHGGTNNAYNLRMTCRACNSSKGALTPFDMLPLA